MRKYLWLALCVVLAFFISLDKFVFYQNFGNDVYSRVDVQWEGEKQNISVITSDAQFFVPSWRNDVIIVEKNFNTKIEHKNIHVKFKAFKDGVVKIFLLGKYVRYERCRKCPNTVIPVFVNYENFMVDNNTVFDGPVKVSYNESFVHKMNVKAGQIVNFSVQIDKPSAFSTLKYCMFDIWAFIAWTAFFVLLYYIFNRFKVKDKIKQIKLNNKISDVLFVVLFALLLFIPMSHITTSDKSTTENRMLATLPNLIQKNSINEKYGQQFDAWFNDRFYGRDQLLNLYTHIKFNIEQYVKNNKAVMSKDGYIFDVIRIGQINSGLKNEKILLFKRSLEQLKSFCSKNNIKLYFLFVPVKEDVLLDKLKYLYGDHDKNRFHKEVSDLFVDAGINFIDPYSVFISHPNKDDLFFQTDHHWTEYGTFVAYQQLSREMAIKSLTEQDFEVFYKNQPRTGSFNNLFDRPFYMGSNCGSLSLGKDLCPNTKEYKYFDHKQKDKLIVENGPIPMSRITHFHKAPNTGNMTILGDSHGGFLLQFFAYTFKNVQMLRVNNEEKLTGSMWDMSRFENHILDFRTNVLLVYLSEQVLSAIQDFYK